MTQQTQNEVTLDPFMHSVRMEFDWETDNPQMDYATDDLLFIFENVRGHKSLLRKHLRLILIVCSRMLKYNPMYYVAYSRSNNFTSERRHRNPLCFTTRPLISVVDALVSEGFLEHYMGFNCKAGEQRSSRFKATEMFIDFIQNYELDCLRFRRELIRGGIALKDGKKRYIYDYDDTPITIRSRGILTAYNELIENTDIRLSNQVSEESYVYDSVQSFRIFNNSDFTQGGRFYGNWWSQCKRDDRPSITINGQPTIELDYKANHLWFIYALEGLEMPRLPDNDPYNVSEEVPREIIKSVFTISINVDNRHRAFKALRKQICLMKDREERQRWRQYIHNQHSFNQISSILVNSHPVLGGYLFTGMGVRLQFMDSQIAEFVLDQMTNQKIPTLCIHDSFIVQRSKEQELKEMMEEAYIVLGYPDHIPSIH